MCVVAHSCWCVGATPLVLALTGLVGVTSPKGGLVSEEKFYGNTAHGRGMTSVLVVDDSDFARTLISGALRDAGLDVVAVVATASEAMSAAKVHLPEAAVLDLNLGVGPNGIDLAQALRRAVPSIGIVILTTYEDPRLLPIDTDSLPLGSVYLVKDSLADIRVLVDAVASSVSDAHRQRITDPPLSDRLTDAQADTLRMVAEGLSNAEIARQRGISERTVENTIGRIALRFGIQQSPDTNLRVKLVRVFQSMTGGSLGA
jgi:DNA-binding NarL/FixJ family response regulator